MSDLLIYDSKKEPCYYILIKYNINHIDSLRLYKRIFNVIYYIY